MISRAAAWLLLGGIASACTRGDSTGTARTVFFRGAAVAAVVEERSGACVRRTTEFDGDAIVLTAELDRDGFVVRARSERRDAHGRLRRAMVLDGREIVDDTDPARPHRRALPEGPVLLVELVHQVRATVPTPATLVDLASGESLSVTVQRRGPAIVVVDSAGRTVVRALPEGSRTGPGAFAEGDSPPGLPASAVEIPVPGLPSLRGRILAGVAEEVAPPPALADVAAARTGADLFLQSDDESVLAFARPLCPAGRPAVEVARAVAEAAHGRVDPGATAAPPSARGMLAHGGDCDGAAALVVAALRACGLPARPLVGYRLVDAGLPSARLVPHAVAEVYTPQGAMKIDATIPALGALDDGFVTVAEGLGGALTIGRLLGRLDGADVLPAPVPSDASVRR